MLCVCFIEKLYFLHKCRRQEKYKSNGQYLTTTCCWSPAMDKVKILPKIKFTAIMTHESVSGRHHFIMTLRGNCRWSIDQCINVYTWYIYTYIYIYVCMDICIDILYICYHENNVPPRLSPQWLCGNTCTWALGHTWTQPCIMCPSAWVATKPLWW